jgi:RNA polymerase sigma-70 factor (ECF subfamily)
MRALEHVGRVSPSADPSNLANLALAVAAGRAECTPELFTRLLPRVRNLVRYLVRGDRDVDDLSQDALVCIYRGLKTYRAEGSFNAWADRIVARSVFAARRKVSVLPVAQKDQDADTFGAGPNAGATPEQESYVLRRQLVTVLDRLPDAQRQAFVLHHVLGMAVGEIAAELGIPEETVRSRLRVGRGQLRAELGETEPLARAGEQR